MHQAAPVKHMELIDGEANEAVFDYSGQYLACAGGKGIVVYHTKVPLTFRHLRRFFYKFARSSRA